MKKKKSRKKSLAKPVQWNSQRQFRNLWNPKDSFVFRPESFGIGWGINFHALLRKLKVLK